MTDSLVAVSSTSAGFGAAGFGRRLTFTRAVGLVELYVADRVKA